MHKRRRLGQHFLRNHAVAEKIAGVLGLSREDTVVEIGPGKGFLTGHLVRKAGNLFLVEVDGILCEHLKRKFSRERNCFFINADFLKWERGPVAAGPVKYAGNLPYSAATAIVQKVLSVGGWSAAVFMFQKEVARRILAEPGSREYGLLAISVGIAALAEPVCEVSRKAFEPVPRVDSMVVRFFPRPNVLLAGGVSEEDFFTVARAAFSQRRKTILNSLSHRLGVAKNLVEGALCRTGINPGQRAEEVSIAKFVKLTKAVKKGFPEPLPRPG